MAPKVIAKDGAGRFVIEVAPHWGQIADVEDGILWPEQAIAQIAAHGAWEKATDIDAADILALVKPR